MPSDDMDMFPSREDILRGTPERRAATALLLIESRTAYMARRARREANPLPPTEEEEGREDAYIRAFTLSSGPRQSVTVQQIEQYALSWAPLVPGTVQVRAALAHRLAGKYVFTYADIPDIRHALGLDDTTLQDAYHALYGVPVSSIFAERVPFRARPAWYWQRFSSWTEKLPPFWMAFALTLPVGSGLMALPIALAGLPPLMALAVIGLLALINMVTAAAMAEVIARSSITRYGQGYLGQVAADWLGPSGSAFLTLAFAADGVLILPVFYLGIASTLAESTGISSPIWVAVIFAVGLYFLTRRTLTTTIAAILVIVVVNLLIVLLIPALIVPHVSVIGLTRARPVLTIGSFQLAFGVLLSNFFSHQQIANYGRVVLRRDPGARHWVRGSMAAIAVTAVISAAWIVTVDGVLPPHLLQNDRGTVVVTLAGHVNGIIAVLGSAFVILSLGMTTIHISLGLLFTTIERLPARIRQDAWLGVVVPVLPVAGIALVTEWLAISGLVSFASLLGFVTVMTLTTLGAFFPILLVLAGRRKSDVRLEVGELPLVGTGVGLGMLYVAFLAVVFAYGLFVWTEPLERAVTLAAGLIIGSETIVITRRGLLDPRIVVEVREDETQSASLIYSILCGGRSLVGTIRAETDEGVLQETAAAGRLPSLSRLRNLQVELPASPATELKVWAHRVTSIGESIALPALLRNSDNARTHVIDLSVSHGWAVIPMTRGGMSVSIEFRSVPEGEASVTASILTRDA